MRIPLGVVDSASPSLPVLVSGVANMHNIASSPAIVSLHNIISFST